MATEAQKAAFDYAWDNQHDNTESIWQNLRYLLKLHELDPGSVTVQFPAETGEDFIRFIFEGVDYVDDPDELTPFWEVFELNTRCIHNQTQAADFCKTTTRTLQRWMSKGLDYIKHKNQVLLDEEDLEVFMSQIGHRRGTQRVGRYGHRVKK